MSEAKLQIELSSPTHPPVLYESSEVVLPGGAGTLTVLPGHTPLLTTLGKGVLIAYESEADARYFAIHDGFAEILDNRVLVLANTMELGENVDRARAEAASERAKGRLDKHMENVDVPRAEAALARSLARLEAHAGQES